MHTYRQIDLQKASFSTVKSHQFMHTNLHAYYIYLKSNTHTDRITYIHSRKEYMRTGYISKNT